MLDKQEIDLAFAKKYDENIYDINKIKFIEIGELHDVFIANTNSQYINKKLSKEDLRNITIYTLKKFSSAYQNLIKALEYIDNDKINIENIDFASIIELLKFRDILAVVTKEYVDEKIKNNELSLVDTDITLTSSKYGIYYNVNNTSDQLKNLIKILKDNCKNS